MQFSEKKISKLYKSNECQLVELSFVVEPHSLYDIYMMNFVPVVSEFAVSTCS